MTPFQWGPSPPEPESYSATSTGTPAPLSPDVAELVRRVRLGRLRGHCYCGEDLSDSASDGEDQ